MALDPRVLAALSAGAKTSGTFDPTAVTGGGGAEKQGAWNLGQWVIDVLSTGGYATAGLTNKVGQNVAAIQRGEIGGFLDLVNPLSAPGAMAKGIAERRTYSENLKEMGVDESVAIPLGLALDIGLDPLTYVTGGTIAGVKGAAQAARGVSKLDESQKIGNLLSGISSGYSKGKANYKVSVAQNKLNRLTTKESRTREAVAEAIDIAPAFTKGTAEAAGKTISEQIVAAEAKATKATSKKTKQQEKLDKLTAKAEGIETPVEISAGKPKPKKVATTESVDEATAVQQATKENLAAQAKVNNNLNKFIQTVVKPGAAVADLAAFNKSRSTFLQKVSNVGGKEVAGLKASSGEIISVKASDLNRYVERPATAGKNADLYEKVLSAPAIIPETLTSLRSAVGETPTIDDLVYLISDRTTPSVIKEQAIRAFEESKAAIQVAETSLPVNRSWVEGIVSADDAGDAARGMVDWIYPSLRKSNSTAYKAISGAIEVALEKKLAAAGKGALSADQVEKIIADFIQNDLANLVNGITKADVAKLIGQGNTYADLAEFIADVQASKVKIDANMKRALSEILGMPATASQAKYLAMLNKIDTGLALAPEVEDAAGVARGAASTADAIGASGVTNADDAARIVDDATNGDLENLPAAVNEMRETAARDFLATLEKTDPALRNQFVAKVTAAIRDTFLVAERAQMEKFAKANDMTFDELIGKVIAGDTDVIKKFGAFNTEGAIKLSEAGSQGRIDLFNRILDLRKGGAYKGMDEQAIAVRESLFLRAAEDLLRSVGIPVRSTETAAAAKIRAGKKAIPMRSSVTWADLVSTMADKGSAELVHRLRKIRGKAGNAEYKLGNFLPTQIEAAWLTINDMLANGNKIAKGSKNWNIVREALDKRILSDGRKVDAYHVELKKSLPKFAKEIDQTADDFIEFVVKNYEELKALDATREALIATSIGNELFPRVANVFARLVKYSDQYRSFKLEAAEALKGGGGTEIVTKFEEDIMSLQKDLSALLKELETGFSDPALAKQMYGLYRSMLINSKGGPGTAALTAPMKALMNTLESSVNTDAAIAKATKGKKGEEAATAGANARRAQKSKQTKQEEAVRGAAAADNAVPGSQQLADDSMFESAAINAAMAKPQTFVQNLNMKFNGSAVMGAMLKALLNAKEHRALSWSHLASKVIGAYKATYRGREAEVTEAFKLLQNFKAEQAAADGVYTIEEFLAATNKTVDRQLFDDLEMMMTGILGDDKIFGLAKANSILPGELADELGKLGIGGDSIRNLKNADSEMAIEEFWHTMELGDRNPFDVVNAMMLAVHKAAANIELGIHFDNFLGKTADELVQAGEDLSKWRKIGIEESGRVGKIIGQTDKLFHVDDIKRLSAVEKYMTEFEKINAGSLQNIIDISDRVTYVLKSTQTLIRPGHWVVSIVGEAAMNALAGVGVRHYHKSARILNRFRPGQYENAGDPMKAYAELSAAKGKRIKEDEFADAYWIRPDGKRGQLSDEAVYTLAEKYGVLIHPGAGIEDFIVSNKGLETKFYGTFHKGMNKLATPASYRDNYFRLTHFMHELERISGAKSLDEAALAAAQEVIKWHPTAGNLSAFEKGVMRRVVYFYTWQRTAVTTVIAKVLEVPGIATVPSKIQYAIADANGFNPESFGDPWDPDGIYASWYTGQLWGPQFQGPGGPTDAWGIQPAIQPIDVVGQIFKPFTLQPGQSPIDSVGQGVGDLFNSNLNPVLKTIIESSAQSRLGEGGDLPSPTEYLINQVGLINTLSKVSGIGQDPNPYETSQEKSEKDFRLWLNLLLGQRLTDYRTPSSDYRWTVDQQEIAQRLSGR